MNLPPLPVYLCMEKKQRAPSLPSHDDEVWNDVPLMELVNKDDGTKAPLSTSVQAYWTQDTLFFRFHCEDYDAVATMTEHDDPIYQEDVVEAFISENGCLETYKEFELSPANVKFDAKVTNDLQGSIQLLTEWHAKGWLTSVRPDPSGTSRTYIWALPFSNFEKGTPLAGDEWRMNCFRIDRGRAGERDLFLTWSPTGSGTFHVPQRFGYLRFISSHTNESQEG